jgi:hypothetical protein
MENRIKKKVAGYTNQFKDDLIKEINKLNDEAGNTQKLLGFITNYSRINFNDDDFSKRKRVKNHVPEYDRCGAKRADGLQCTRRKKCDHSYCGTHLKGTPHGEITVSMVKQKKKVELSLVNVAGIVHYVDETGKQYSAESVLNMKEVK